MNRRRTTQLSVALVVMAGATAIVGPTAAPAATSVVQLSGATVDQVEGNSGTVTATVNATLDQASTSTVTVQYATVDSTAKVSKADYVAASGVVTFTPGQTSKPITVTINGDTALEDYELLSVKISAPTNATLGNAVEKIQILNDDKPRITMASVKVTEGSPAQFKPRLLQRYYQPITINANTSNGTAVAPGDYTTLAGTVTFPAGSKTPLTVAIPTISDSITEPKELFNLTVGGPAVVASLKRTATINPQGCTGAAAPTKYDHVVVVVMENHHYSEVIGNSGAPWLTGLAKACATATSYAQAASPSRPNYLAMAAGDVFDCAGNNSDPAAGNCNPTSGSLFKQVIDAGGTTTVYAEGMNGNCDATSHGTYAVKHNAWPYFPSEAALCQQFNKPMPASIDVNNLPTLLEIMPDLCHDTHDCSVATGDAWLQQYIQPVLDSAAYASGTTAVIVTYDEYTNLPNAFASRSVTPGKVYATATTHYGLLRTIEDMLGLTPLGQAAAATGLRAPMHL